MIQPIRFNKLIKTREALQLILGCDLGINKNDIKKALERVNQYIEKMTKEHYTIV